MISLRSHAISLAAVFLALAIGVVLGSGLLSDTVLSGLRKDKADLHNQINTLTDDKNALNEKLSAAGEFDSLMAPRILRDTLGGKSVVIFRTPDAADDDVDAVTRLATQGGATVTGAISLSYAPAAMAFSARFCERTAKWSMSSRETSFSRARFSAVCPIAM